MALLWTHPLWTYYGPLWTHYGPPLWSSYGPPSQWCAKYVNYEGRRRSRRRRGVGGGGREIERERELDNAGAERKKGLEWV